MQVQKKMTIPKYDQITLPLLEFLSDRKEHSLRDTINHIIEHFALTEEEIKERIPSGYNSVIDNRVGWARTHLKKAGLIAYTRRGHFIITRRGSALLKTNPQKIDKKILEKYPEYLVFIRKNQPAKFEEQEESSPRETLDTSYNRIENELKSDLLEQLAEVTPQFFEKLVVELLLAMGYGGSIIDAGKAIGRTNDEGLDGVIKEDKLGLDNIYLQAKRWKSSVGRPVIQNFVGALQGKKAKKGVLITTSRFTKGASEYVSNIETKVALIDGNRLAELLIEHNIGVFTRASYHIKEIDFDYFLE